MALYWHVPSKAALLEAVAEALLERLELPAPDESDWEPAVRRYAASVRRLARRHPRLFPVIASLSPTDPAVRRTIAAFDRLWQNAGFGEGAGSRASRAIHGYVIGATLWEANRARRAADRRAPGSDEAFEFGLEMLVRGLAAEPQRQTIEPATAPR